MDNLPVVIFVIIVIIVGLQIDDDLEPAVKGMLDKAQARGNGGAYYYLMGLDAAAGEDPVKVGKMVYASILQGEEEYLNNGEEFDYQKYPDELRLPLPDSRYFCSGWDAGCIESLFQDSSDLDEIIDNHAVLIERYREFNLFNEFSTLSRPSLFEPFPAYQYIRRANRLMVLHGIREAKKSNTGGAISLLLDNISNLRKQLAHADTLVGKLVFLLQISENLDVIALIAREEEHDHSMEIQPLSSEEKNFDVVIAREFGMAYDTSRSLDRNPEFFTDGGFVPGWLIRLFFKPNMTTNAIFPVYYQTIEYSTMSHMQFASEAVQGDRAKIRESLLRNPAGVYINRTGMPDYKKYVARFFDLDAKILLFNAAMDHSNIKLILESETSPYYGAESLAYLTDDHKRICFDGPLPDSHNLRCLMVEFNN